MLINHLPLHLLQFSGAGVGGTVVQVPACIVGIHPRAGD